MNPDEMRRMARELADELGMELSAAELDRMLAQLDADMPRDEMRRRMREMMQPRGDGDGRMPMRSLAVSIKAQTDDTLTLAGWGVVFGGADLTNERFTKDTDFWLDRFGGARPVLYDHSFNDAVKAEVLGSATITPQDDGLWVEAELTKHNRYVQQITKLAEAGVLGWSSGAVAHLVEAAPAEDGVLTYKRWPIAEMSLTVTPAEPRTLGVEQIRALIDSTQAHADALKGLLPEATAPASDLEGREGAEAAAAQPPEAPPPTPPPDGTKAVADQDEGHPASGGVSAFVAADAPAETPPDAPPEIVITPAKSAAQEQEQMELEQLASEVASTKSGLEATKSGLDTLNTLVQQVLAEIQSAPKIKNAGYITMDGGEADQSVKSFGDFLLAVSRNDTKRLVKVYQSTKDLAENPGTTGGYLVPHEYQQELLRVASMSSQIVSQVRRIPVRTDAGSFPALNQFAAPTAGVGDSAFAGGITAAVTAEAGSLTETQATFKEIVYRIHKVGGYTEVSSELIADSPFAVEQLLTSLFSIAIMSKLEHYILRGTGAGQPQGILEAPCTIGVTTVSNNVFAYADALAMRSRFKRLTDREPVWIIHPGVWPDIGTFEVSSGSGGVWQANLASGSPERLLGYRILESEHMPQDDNDDVILADLGAYLLFDRQGLSVAYSEHAAFTTDKGTWRFTTRMDGQPWLTSAITLADPQGSYTVSPFVFHND